MKDYKHEPKIEKNVPLPFKRSTREVNNDFYSLWLKLKPGDSLFYDFDGMDQGNAIRKLLVWKRRFLKDNRLNWDMTTRTVEGGVRIWRIE
jgi:hypothetical protein